MRNKIIELLVESGTLTAEQGESIANTTPTLIANGDLSTYNDAQLAIYFTFSLVEKLGADVELTNTLCDLQTALNRLTAYLIKQQS